MFIDKIKKAWQKRSRKHQIEKAGKQDWRIFAKALCNSSSTCEGFPVDCLCCFDSYFKATNRLEHRKKNSLNIS
jgi:hypothetical protein